MTNPPTFASELLASMWVVVPVLSVFGLCEWLYHRQGVSGEVTRKISHVSAGVVIVCMPWVVRSHWTVLAMSLGFVLVLAGAKALRLLPSVHAVSRRTAGAEYYPVAVYATWLLADGEALLFQIPILVMAFSDTGAAVVGRRYALVRYRVIEDYRSLGGSVTFFGLTFALVLVGLGLSGAGDLPSVLLVTLLTAMVATAVEGISVGGADNLLVPYATFMVLQHTMHAGREALGDWILGAALVLSVLLVSFRQARLNATGFMAAFVGGVLAWGLGGPVWLMALLVPYIAFATTQPFGPEVEADLALVVPAFAVSMFLVLLFGHTGAAALFVPFLGSVACVTAIALASAVRSRVNSGWLELASALLGSLLSLLPALAMDVPVVLTPVALATVLVGALLALALSYGPLRIRTRSAALSRVAAVAGGTTSSAVWMAAHLL